jgi:hypothetical protein
MFSLLAFVPDWATAQGKGSFRGRFAVERLRDNGRERMHLLERLEFVAPDGRAWSVPSGIVVDGSSIPKAFWSLMVGPFEEPYQKASILLDYFCEERATYARDVHRAFYDALLASGVAESRAWILYRAVETYGPAWRGGRFDAGCELLDHYDFSFCTRTATKPAVSQRNVDRGSLERFLRDVEEHADPEDVVMLRRVVKSLP